MQPENYRQNLIHALENLVTVNESVYQSIIDLAMQGELKAFNDTVPLGEVHQFDYELFKNMDDKNVQLLIEVIDKVHEVYHSIANINSIELNEE
jgi:hypothetical protein